MPVTIRSAAHPARAWGVRGGDAASTPEQLLKASCPREYRRCSEIIQSSMERIAGANIFPSTNGLVKAAYAAYSNHHHLTIRPEDVWFAILTQLSFHINAHAEELRHLFVAHEGQKELEVVDAGSIDFANFGKMALWMTKEMEKHILLPELREWVMPDFSTTGHKDLVTAAILMMGSMQKYFSYKVTLYCGIPSVTLLGERDDWVKLRRRLELLPSLGQEPSQFGKLLGPVLDHFVRSFDDPASPDTISFWSRIADQSGGSGPYYLSGWITAFCFWSADGTCLYRPPQGPVVTDTFGSANPGCNLDGVLYHRVDTNDIPEAMVSVPVTVDDDGHIYKTRMVAGLVGIEVSSSGDFLDESQTAENNPHATTGGPFGERIPETVQPRLRENTGMDSIRPFSGWWMYEVVDVDEDDGYDGSIARAWIYPQESEHHPKVNPAGGEKHPLLRKHVVQAMEVGAGVASDHS